MNLISVTSPHTTGPSRTQRVMAQVLLATLPGLTVLYWLFGWGSLINALWACAVALACEAAVLRLRGKPIGFHLADGSALVTAVLLALAIPPTAPWWLTLVGVGFAIIFAKQLYGGLGMNPFNPAMAGYVLLLISFPVDMTRWLPPFEAPDFSTSLQLFFGHDAGIDALTGATPLDSFRTWAGDAAALAAQPVLHGTFAGLGWEWVNLAFLAGGLWLLWRRVISWHIPVALLGALALCALPFWLYDSARFASPLFHLFSGAAMFGAFFIATDPVSAATSRPGRLIFAALIGVLVWVIRSFGGYPDAMAFAVLLLNLAAPTIDYYTRPRSYGHSKPKRGIGG